MPNGVNPVHPVPPEIGAAFVTIRPPAAGTALRGGEKSRSGAVKAELSAGNPQQLELDVAVPEAEPGTLHVLDVVQRRGSKEIVPDERVLLLTVDEKRY